MGDERDVYSVLVVDDEPDILQNVSLLLRRRGIAGVTTLDDGRKVMDFLGENSVSVLLLDLMMPHLSGNQLLPELTRRFPEIPVIILTAFQDLQMAVECMKAGAFDYLVKPVEDNRLLATIRRALEICALRAQVGTLRNYLLTDGLHEPKAFSDIVTGCRKMRSVFQYAEAVGASLEPILIIGETGVGKELLVEALHRVSGRKGNLVSLNVAGLDDMAFSDTLFGHRKGAFTGAGEHRSGLIEQAGGGTLFLDEIGDLGEAAQIKLLRLLQEKSYFPLGSDTAKKSTARIITATNRDLSDDRQGRQGMRNDLYYRLSTHLIRIPPLRERSPDDLPLLVSHFIAQAAFSMGKEPPQATAELMGLLRNHSFPGNVRELRGLVFDAVARHGRGAYLSVDTFRQTIRAPRSASLPTESALQRGAPGLFGERFPTLKEAEDLLIQEALQRTGGNQGNAAILLGISRQALNKRLHREKRQGP